MIGISAIMALKEEIVAVTAIVLGLSWIATKVWVPLDEWKLENMIKLSKKGLKQWIVMITGFSFFIGTPFVLVELLNVVNKETNSWALKIIIGLMVTQVAISRIVRENSVRIKKGKYERGGLAANEHYLNVFAILWISLIITTITIGASSKVFSLILVLLLEGGTQFTLGNQNMKRMTLEEIGAQSVERTEAGIKKLDNKRMRVARNILEAKDERQAKVRKFMEYRSYY